MSTYGEVVSYVVLTSDTGYQDITIKSLACFSKVEEWIHDM